MILIQEIVVSRDVISSYFTCQLQACHGACCREGDFGAPLEQEEMEKLDAEGHILVDTYLSKESEEVIKKEGFYKFYPEMETYGTALRKDEACVFLSKHGDGIERCGIEKAYANGDISLQKPISCHLYPIRIEQDPTFEFTAMNYDRWDICDAACTHGKKLSQKLYEFAKDAIIRRFGLEFYEELRNVAQYVDKNDEKSRTL